MNFIIETERIAIGNLVELVNEEDYPTNYYSWMNDQVVTKYNSWGLFPYTKSTAKDYAKELEKSKNIIAWSIFAKSSSAPTAKMPVHIGNVTLQNINWINRSAEFAVVIGEKEYWGKGYTTEAAQLLFSHGFNKLNLHRIWTGTAATNIGMRKVAKKLGMTNEGVFRQATFLDGKYVDIYEFSIFEEEWRSQKHEQYRQNP